MAEDKKEPIPETRLVRVIEAEVYSRVVGYFRPVQNWNRGKQVEFQDRKLHTMPHNVG